MYSQSSNGSEVSLPNYGKSCTGTDSGVSSSDSLLNSGKRCSDGVVLELAKLSQKVSSQDDAGKDDLLYYKLSEDVDKTIQQSNADASTNAIPRSSSVFLTAMDSQGNAYDNGNEWGDTTSVSTGSINIEEDTPNTSSSDPAIICSKCYEVFKDPRLLPCLHSFCLKCLQQSTGISKSLSNISLGRKSVVSSPSDAKVFHSTALSNARSFDTNNSMEGDYPTVTCHTCKNTSRVPISGLSGFPSNHMLHRMVLLHQIKDGNTRTLSCDLCCDVQSRPSPMQGRCMQCSLNLCHFCILAHNRQKPTASHTVLNFDECSGNDDLVSSDKIPALCNLHPLEELRLYCSKCDILVCRDCCLSPQHTKHSNNCVYLNDVVNEHVADIRIVYQKCEPRIQIIKNSMTRIENSEQDVQRTAKETVQQIDRHIKSYIKVLHEHKSVLLQQLDAISQKKISDLSDQYQSLKRILCDVENTCGFTTELLGSGTEADILTAKPYLIERLHTLSKVNLNSKQDIESKFVEFHPNRKNKVWLYDEMSSLPQHTRPRIEIELWGNVISKSPCARYCMAYGEGIHSAKTRLPSEFYVIAKSENNENVEHGGDMVSVEVTPVRSNYNAKWPKTQVVDKMNGSYRVLYVVHEPGNYRIDVKVSGQQISGSPFNVSAVNAHAENVHAGVYHCCTFCSSGGDKNATCGCGAIMAGGFSGCGHGHAGHPGCSHWSCCGNTIESSECSLQGGGNKNTYRTLPSNFRKSSRTTKLPYKCYSPSVDDSMYATTSTLKAQKSPYFNVNSPFDPNPSNSKSKSNVKTVSL